MSISKIIALTLFLVFTIFLIFSFIAHFLLQKYLIKQVDIFIKRIETINSKKVNFKLKNAFVYAQHNKLYTDLVASWTVSSKEMRITTAMASLHVKHLVNLIKNGKFIHAMKYLSVLSRSTQIFETQWNLLIKDIDEFINFTSQPNSILIDLKQVFSEVATLCQEIIGSKQTKTSLILQNKINLIEHLFEKFEEITSKGNYDHAFKIVMNIRDELKKFSSILKGIPYVAYLIGQVFKQQKSNFRNLHKLARNEGLVMEKLQPAARYKKIVKKVVTYNEAFLSRDVSGEEVSEIIIDEIINLSKLSVFLNAEISANNKYYEWYGKTIDWIRTLNSCWDSIMQNNLFWPYSTVEIEAIDYHAGRIEASIMKHKKQKKQSIYPLYTELLTSLIGIVKEGNEFNDMLRQSVRTALNSEKEREKMKTNMIISYSNIKSFWRDNVSIPYDHIHEYFNKSIKLTQKKHSELLNRISNAMYNDFSILNLEVKGFSESIDKLQWEVDTLIKNENNIRKLYEIANRYRAESPEINTNLDVVEKLIFNHDIRNAYAILKKILKQFDAKDLKKYPIIVD